MKYRRVVIKLSGEALANNKESGILSKNALLETANAIKSIQDLGVQIVVIIGAGNICRGSIIESTGIDRVTGDYMGMLGTIINSFALRETIKNLGGKAEVLTAVTVKEFAQTYSPELANEYLNNGYVTICGGGLGKPFFTTDTCATQRAIDTHAEAIFMAKNGVDGIFDSDPRLNKDAKMYKEIKCSDIIKQNLKVMDLTAVEMLKDQNIDGRVFNMKDSTNFLKVINGEDIGTTIKKG